MTRMTRNVNDEESGLKITRVSGPGALSLNMCPDCGGFQLTVPTGEVERLSVLIDMDDMMGLIQRLIVMVEMFHKHKADLNRNVFLPINCCGPSRH